MRKDSSLLASLTKRRHFLPISTIFIGTISAIWGTLWLDELGPQRVFFVAPAAYLAAYISSEVLWRLMFGQFKK